MHAESVIYVFKSCIFPIPHFVALLLKTATTLNKIIKAFLSYLIQ